jgi:cellulose biosynthesis protein BcsQ
MTEAPALPARVKTIAFFNNKGGVGKTTIAYHLAWMFYELGYRVLAVDLDPQANLTAAFLDDEELEQLWPITGTPRTIYGALLPLIEHLGDLSDPFVGSAMPQMALTGGELRLLPGDLNLSAFEDRLAEAWPACLSERRAIRQDALRVMSAFYRAILRAGERGGAQIALIDMGPSLGALSRAALVSADYVVIPMAADLFSLRGLYNLGPVLREWREGWRRRLAEAAQTELTLPGGDMQPIGYILQPSGRERSPSKAYQHWIDKFPAAFHRSVLGEDAAPDGEDRYLLATLRNYLSLVPLAHAARKPVFALRAADGALGSHARAAKDSFTEFEGLARRIATACGLG